MNLIKKCQCCENSDLIQVLSLPDTPLTDAYQITSKDSLHLKKYPLVAFFCRKCTHLQLSIQVSAEESYSNYLYKSQVTLGLKEEFVSYAKQICNYFKESNIDILDVGSNDGSFLMACKESGINAFGVEPSKDLAKYANSQGLRTINSFFEGNFLKELSKNNFPFKFDVISFNNVLANIGSPIEALILAKSLLKSDKSLIVVQTGYHPILFSKGIFDYIYHEHYSYFNLRSLRTLAKKCNFNLFNFDILPLRAGTIRCAFSPKREEMLDNYINERFNRLEEFSGLNYLIKSSKEYLINQIRNYKKKGCFIIGYGASHSTGTLVHTLGIIPFLDLVVDENESKHNKFMPGSSLQVKSPSKIKEYTNSVVIVLAWQYFEQIKKKLILSNFAGPIIKPVLP